MKKTILFPFLGFIISLLLFSSCNDFLDIKPKGFLIPETAEDFEQLLNSADILKASESYPVFMTDDAYIPDDISSNYFPSMKSVDRMTRNLYTFDKEVFGDSESDDLWVGSYNRIYTYNIIVRYIDDATEATQEQKNIIKAEALMGRAFEYLTLVNAYGKAYDAETANTDLGVPLILDEDINKTNLTRASVQEVYDLIKKDLEEADKYLPDRPKLNAFRASKPVGLGMLARMYLYMGNYAQALKYANESLKKNDILLDLKNYKVVDNAKAMGRIDVPEMGDNVENIYIRMAPYVFGNSGSVYISTDLKELFEDNDKRFMLYFTNEPFETPIEEYLYMPYTYTNMAMTTPEMYLIAAECEARIGSAQRAMELINTLRNHRIVDNQPITAESNEAALKIVLDERRREFAMVGCFRLIDLKRLNKEPRFAKTITRVVEGKTYTLEPNSPKYVLPIPAKVLKFNPNMQDNIR